MKRIIFLMLGWGLCLIVQAQTTNFSKLNFGCDGSSTTSGNQWSKTVVDLLGFASHHNVAVGSSTFACHPDTQDYNSDNFAGISDGWKPTKDKKELQMRHNNVSKVHIQKFISEVKDGVYPAPDVFVFAMGSNDTKLDGTNGKLREELYLKDRLHITPEAYRMIADKLEPLLIRNRN